MFYENNHESTAFQLYVLDIFDSVLTKLENELDNTITTHIVLDRCILSVHVFARTLYKDRFIQPFSYEYCWRDSILLKTNMFFPYQI